MSTRSQIGVPPHCARSESGGAKVEVTTKWRVRQRHLLRGLPIGMLVGDDPKRAFPYLLFTEPRRQDGRILSFVDML